MNKCLLPWCIICATLAQTSALVVSAFAVVRFILYTISMVFTGKGKEDVDSKMEKYIAIEGMTYVPIFCVFFGAYTSMRNLLAFRNPWACLSGPFVYIKTIRRQAENIYAYYIELKQTGGLEQDEDSFFSWGNNNPEVLRNLMVGLPLKPLGKHS